MKYEVEMKFPAADVALLESKLAELGGTPGETQLENDVYFAHPARDFRQTDEALRIREKGERFFITYKGPKIDPATKTRREIDLPLPAGRETMRAWTELLESLGFVAAGQVRKSRRKAHVSWQGQLVEISLDEVQDLGSFVELELIVEPAELETAKKCIVLLAERLGLSGSERRSYLELLEKRDLGIRFASNEF